MIQKCCSLLWRPAVHVDMFWVCASFTTLPNFGDFQISMSMREFVNLARLPVHNVPELLCGPAFGVYCLQICRKLRAKSCCYPEGRCQRHCRNNEYKRAFAQDFNKTCTWVTYAQDRLVMVERNARMISG